MKRIMFIMFASSVAFTGGASAKEYEKAIFGGGCFWCMVHPFDEFPGVIKVVSGYTGGNKEDPTYEEVSSGKTGHVEAVEITFDPEIITYAQLLDIFWRQIDPTDQAGQFADRGPQYKAVIFYLNPEQKRLAQESKQNLEKSGRFKGPVVTPILPAAKFYRAEEYHQDYYKKNPDRYDSYRSLSGRGGFLKRTWGREKGGKDD